MSTGGVVGMKRKSLKQGCGQSEVGGLCAIQISCANEVILARGRIWEAWMSASLLINLLSRGTGQGQGREGLVLP